jgi:hypothetical protein
VANQGGAVGGELDPRLGERFGGHLAGAIVAGTELADPLGIMIVAGHRAMLGERHGEGQANVPQPDYGSLRCAQLLLSETSPSRVHAASRGRPACLRSHC